MKLWLVEIHDDDFEYDYFVSAVVWAETEPEAEQLIRGANRGYRDGEYAALPRGEKTRLIVKPAPESGIVHEHWHPG